jgi:hypothetical protein
MLDNITIISNNHEGFMKITIKVVIEQESKVITENIISIARQKLSAETLGLNTIEAKQITSGIQQVMTHHQIKDYISEQKTCNNCGEKLMNRGYHSLKYRTLFGKLSLKSPRLLKCNCHKHKQKSFSPLTKLLSDHASPELMYLESKWVSLMSYDLATNLLSELLPLKFNHSSVQSDAKKISTRIEKELGKESYIYIEGSQRDWYKLPKPDAPLTVGIDGGYIHAREGDNRKAGWIEAIVGKSLQEEKETKRFGYVVNYEQKPKRKLYEMLHKQGLQMNQEITFLSDGGDTVRELPMYLSPNSEHILDWFHITMKITVMKQMTKGLNDTKMEIEEKLELIKWCIWHGNVHKALEKLEDLNWLLDEAYSDKKERKGYKLWKTVDEFYGYIQGNSQFIPNYNDRYHHDEIISTSFVESTVNELISKRMSKKQQMRWTKEGAHLMLQLRVKTLNNELGEHFRNWYPQIKLQNNNLDANA